MPAPETTEQGDGATFGLIRDDTVGPLGKADAIFNTERTHRYLLRRRWADDGPVVTFVMCNPSTADAFVVDPTVRRCVGFAQREGAAELRVVNVFALRSTDPQALYTHPDPVGHLNDWFITDAATSADVAVAAWGTHGKYRGRGLHVARMLAAAGCQLHTLGVTKDGHPKHPLRLAASSPLVPFLEEA